MFELFKRKKIIHLPEKYNLLVDEKDYAIFINKCLSALKDLGYKIISFDNGDIEYKNEKGEEAHFFLDNILRKYIQASDKEKDNEILSHFTKQQDFTEDYQYIYKDFESAKQYLKVLLKQEDFLPDTEDFVFQNDLPSLLTILVLDFEDQFHYINRSKINHWGIDDKTLFQVALNNISREGIEFEQFEFDDEFNVLAIFSTDSSPSYILLIEEELDYAIGEFGSLVALPTRGKTFIYPIEVNNVLKVIVSIYPTIEEYFEEDSGNITLDFYWYYQGQFKLFEKTPNDDGSVTINIPKQLKELFK